MPPPAITNNIEMELAKLLAREDGCHIRLYKLHFQDMRGRCKPPTHILKNIF